MEVDSWRFGNPIRTPPFASDLDHFGVGRAAAGFESSTTGVDDVVCDSGQSYVAAGADDDLGEPAWIQRRAGCNL